MNGWQKLGGGEGSVNDRNWVGSGRVPATIFGRFNPWPMTAVETNDGTLTV